MKKGKLLNEKYKIEYQKLPDTLYTLEYGEYLYPLFYEDHKKDEENNWFSPIDEHDLEVFNKNLDSMVDIKNMKYMVQYLNLVAKKAVSPQYTIVQVAYLRILICLIPITEMNFRVMG